MTVRVLLSWGLLAALVGGIAYLLLSATGLALVWGQVAPYLAPTVQAEAVSGRLVGPIRIRGLTVDGASFHMRLDQAELDWEPLALLGGDLMLDYLRGEGLRITHRPAETSPATEPSPSPAPLEAWTPPVALEVQDLDLRRVSLYPSPEAEPRTIRHLQAEIGAGADAVYARNLRVAAPALTLSGEATVAPSGDYPLEASLDWALTLPEQPRLSGRTRLNGDLGQALTLIQRMDPPLPLQAEVRIDNPLTEPRWALSARAENLDPSQLADDLPPVTGDWHLVAEGDTASAQGRLTLQGRHPDVGPFRTAANFGAELAGTRLVLDQVEATADEIPGRITARGEIARPDQALHVDLRGDWTGLRWPFSGRARWRSPSGRWRLSGTPTHLAATVHGRVNDRGRVDAALTYGAEDLGGKIRWRNLAWPDRELDLASPDGELTVTGRPSDYTFHLDAGLDHAGDHTGRIRSQGRGDLEGLVLERFRAEVLGGTLDGEGKAAWHPHPDARLDLRFSQLDPGLWLDRWPGSLEGRITAAGSWPKGGPRVELPRLDLSGHLRDREVAVSGSGSFRPGRLEVAGLELAAEGTTATVKGRVAEDLDLNWRVDSPDLGVLHPEAGGSLGGSGRLTGTRTEPAIRTEITGADIAFAEHHVGKLELAGRLDLGGAEPSDMRLAVDEAVLAGRPLKRLRLELGGQPLDHTLDLAAATETATVEASLDGRWRRAENHWDFTLNRAQLGWLQLPRDWHLEDPASGSAGPGRATLEEACFTAGGPRLCLAGEVAPDKAAARYRAQALPLGYLLPLLPPGTALEGRVGGSGKLAWEDGILTGEAELATGSGQLLHTRGDEEPGQVVAFRPSRVRLSATPEAIRARAELDLGQADHLRANLRVPQDRGPLIGAPATGRLQGQITELGVVPVMVPEITELKGRAEADLRLQGSLGRPGWSGRIAVSAERLGLDSPGITFQDLTLAAEPGPQGTLELTGSARSGGGRLQLAGQTRLGEEKRQGDLRLWGQDFQIYDTPRARVWVSPELSLALSGRDLAVDGQIRVPRAAITLKDLPAQGAVTVSPDQVIVRPEEAEEEAAVPWRVTSQVRLVMGDAVSLEGFGLSSRIGGDLTLVTEPDRPTTASGELRTEEGIYRAYGQRLTIETGKLLFGGGPVSDPGLEVRAVRRPRTDILVGVRASGRLREPRFELFSEPPMTQSEQLSWLVLGRSLENTSGGEHAALSRAALMLGARGGGKVAEAVGTELGLDEVGLQTQPGETGEETALVLGKHLSPRLYVSYGIGLFEAVNTLRMQYTLSEHWQLVTESSTRQTGGDLFYTIETGK
ncbi:translocation/assembly module TamB domain-containing protein [Thiohalorhabdus sp.]|uniref:translocation/assembly module TamB domain-containing protein n=1 Tax=Thiohalorhabdus sp. TaxID=3094134 RepID=UPI002FC2F7AB